MKLKKLLSVILAAVMLLGCMSITAFADAAPDLSMLTTGAKIRFGTQDDTTVEWVIGGDGTNGMSVPTGCIALVTSDVVASGVVFSSNYSNVYANSDLKIAVESAVTFTEDEQAAIKERTLAGNQTYGADCDGVAGDSVTATVWAPTTKDAYALYAVGLSILDVGYWLCSPGEAENRAALGNIYGVDERGANADGYFAVRAALYIDLSKVTNVTLVEGTTDTYILNAPEEPEEDPSGVDLSMLTTGAKIQLGTQDDTPVEWVIGGDGTTGMSVPTGCIALVTSDVVASDVVASDVAFSSNDSNVYAASNLKTAVESAVTFTDDEQAAIKERTLAGNQTYGEDCDGVAGDSVIATVWAPTTKDAYGLSAAGLSAVGSEYWLCSPGANQYSAALVLENGTIPENGHYVGDYFGVRAALYLDLSKVYGATAVEGETDTYTLNLTAPSTFLTTFTLNKDYNDKYTTDAKTTAVSETVTYTITPISTGDDVPAFSETATTQTPFTFTIDVTDGVGSADVTLPETITQAGDYWYKIQETGGKTAGVTYDTATYYLHLITDCKNGEFGVLSAAIRTAQVSLGTDGTYPTTGKIDTVSNSYGEGKLKITQDTTVDGADNDYDEFKVTVTFTLPTGTEITGEITYGDQTIAPEDWTDGSVTVTVDLKGGEYVEFIGIPDGTTYTVEQTDSNTDLGFGDPDYTVENGETADVVVTDETSGKKSVTGTISDGEDDITIANEMITPVDVGVILESGAFIILALGAIAFGVWLIVSKRRKSLDAE